MSADGHSRRVAFIGLGSNLAEPATQIEAALEHLAGVPRSEVHMRSSLYRSAPYGPIEQPDFVNAVIAMTTGLGPRELLAELQAIETRMGRERGERWGPRIIDLDLLVFGAELIHDADLVVPHPGIAERNFVLLPLREIAPDLDIPGVGRVADLPVSDVEPRIERIADRNGQT